MHTRKINLLDILGDTGILKAEIMDKVIDNSAHLLAYEVGYSVMRKGEEDYEVLPFPSLVALDCSAECHYAALKAGADIPVREFLALLGEIRSDAEWWEGENRDMLIELSEDRFEDE